MGIRSEIDRNQVRFPTRPDGTGTVDLGSCAYPVRLIVYPLVIGFAGESEVVTCDQRRVSFSLERNERYSAMEAALRDLGRSESSNNVILWRVALKNSLENETPADAARAAIRLAALFRRTNPVLSTSYYSVAVEAGQRAVSGNTWSVDVNGALTLDRDRREITLTPEGTNQLARFQAEAQIPVSGQWDRSTFVALRLNSQWPPVPNE